MGLIALAGAAASGAIFALGVVGQYVCNTTVILARWLGPERANFKRGPFHLGAMSLPVSIVAVSFMIVMAVILCFPAQPEVDAVTMNYTALVFGGVVLFATAYYWMPVVGGNKWFKGPAVTADTEIEEIHADSRHSKESERSFRDKKL